MVYLTDLRSAYVTRFLMHINTREFFHMFPTLHCNSLLNSGVTKGFLTSIAVQNSRKFA